MSQRGISTTLQAVIQADELNYFHLVEFNFVTSFRVTDGAVDYNDGGDVYSATGDLIKVDKIDESASPAVTRFSIILSGVDLTNVSTALTEDYTNCEVNIWRIYNNTSEVPYSEKIPLFVKGRIDSFTMSEDIETGKAEIKWLVDSHWANFDRIAGRRTNDTDQQRHFAGDLGFEFAAQMVVGLRWGGATSLTEMNIPDIIGGWEPPNPDFDFSRPVGI